MYVTVCMCIHIHVSMEEAVEKKLERYITRCKKQSSLGIENVSYFCLVLHISQFLHVLLF